MVDSLSYLSVKVNSPDQIIWEGRASAVSSINAKGPFDILPLHANFITIVENKPIKIKTKEKILEYKFTRAVIHISKNQVRIFANI